MAQDHFLQAAARITLMVRDRQSATSGRGAGIRVSVSASSKGGDWRTIPAEMPSPKVTLPGTASAHSGQSGLAR